MTDEAAKPPPAPGFSFEVFYLNVLLKNKEEVVAVKVQEKAGKGLLGKLASSVANHYVSEATVLSTVSEQLKLKIEQICREMGIECILTKRFSQGPYVVFSVNVVEFEKLSLVLAVKGEEYASSFSRLLSSLDMLGMADVAYPKIEEKMNILIHDGMMKKFVDLIPAKMLEQGLVVDVYCKEKKDQADFFYDYLPTVYV